MLSAIKKLILFLDLVLNHGISPSTIIYNKPSAHAENYPLKKSGSSHA